MNVSLDERKQAAVIRFRAIASAERAFAAYQSGSPVILGDPSVQMIYNTRVGQVVQVGQAAPAA